MKPTPVPLVGLIKLANQTHLKKTYSLPAIFLFLAPARFCGTSFPAASLAHVMSFVRQNTRSRGRNGSYFAIRAEAPGHRGCAEAFHEVILQGSVGGANT